MEIPPAHGYSLWIVPPEPIYGSLKDEIARQSMRLGTPKFEPHLTLLGGLKSTYPYDELIANIRRFIGSATALKPIRIEVYVATWGLKFYQCVYLPAKLTDPLRKLHELARISLHDTPDESKSFMPHISIVYGDIPLQTRAGTAEEIGAQYLRYPGWGFEAKEIQLWSTEGPPNAWHLISAFQL